ncbi:MAG TPA: hypothetical protein VGF37_04825 [Chthoniobacterales bacterium]
MGTLAGARLAFDEGKLAEEFSETEHAQDLFAAILRLLINLHGAAHDHVQGIGAATLEKYDVGAVEFVAFGDRSDLGSRLPNQRSIQNPIRAFSPLLANRRIARYLSSRSSQNVGPKVSLEPDVKMAA